MDKCYYKTITEIVSNIRLTRGMLKKIIFRKLKINSEKKITKTSENNSDSLNVLELNNVGFCYKHDLLNNISLTIKPGEIFCLLGPSGIGKSTLLRLIAGLETCHCGTIKMQGQIVTNNNINIAPHKRNIALVFQDYGLFPHLTVKKNIEIALPNSLKQTSKLERVNKVMSLTEMLPLSNSYCQSLSGGEQQRVALARALAVQPKLILMDEPFSNLDLRLREKVRNESLNTIRRYGMAALIVTHDAEEAQLIADRMAVLQNGVIQQCGTPDQLYKNPINAGVAKILGHSNTFKVKYDKGSVRTPFGEIIATREIKNSLKKKNRATLDCIVQYKDIIIGEESIPGQLLNAMSAKITAIRHLNSETRVDCILQGKEKDHVWAIHCRMPRREDILLGQWRKLKVDEKNIRLCL